MKQMPGKDLARWLEQHDWVLLHIQSSHHIYGKPGSTVRLSVLIHGSQPLKTGLLRHLLKMAGLTDKDLESRMFWKQALQYTPFEHRLAGLGGPTKMVSGVLLLCCPTDSAVQSSRNTPANAARTAWPRRIST